MASETKREKTRVLLSRFRLRDCFELSFKDRFDVYAGSLGKPIDVSGKINGGLNVLLEFIELPSKYDIEYVLFHRGI